MKLYHGSPKRLIGGKLIPRQPHDVNNEPSNLAKGVYATDIKNAAIAMAIISCKGIIGASLNTRNAKTPGLIYEGSPTQDYIYLYTIDSKYFKQSGQIHQFVSEVPVKPIKKEKLKVEDYLSLVRNANNEEIKGWNKRLNKWMMNKK